MAAATTVEELSERVGAAAASGTALRLRGGGSKDFYGGLLAGELLDLSACRGVIAYEPTELYITARCGTPLAEVEAVLAERGQMLAFEPPHFGAATVGGCIAAGLAGPRRQQAGAVRDFVLGLRLIDGTGQVLDFGGQVMKNVAGYDVSRLLAGSLGTLGLIAEATLKVLPRPMAELTLGYEMTQAEAVSTLNGWGGKPLPITASFWHDGQLAVRFSGARAAVEGVRQKLGGAVLAQADAFWLSVREQQHPAFAATPLWRLALPSTAVLPAEVGVSVLEWGGAQRWVAAAADGEALRGHAAAAGGHAVLFRAAESARCREGCFAPLAPPALALHRRLKKVFDPHAIFNPGRLYAEL